MPALVVFDLDGTLVDSRQDLATSTNDMLGAFGAPPLPVSEVERMVGDGARALVQRALARAACAADLDEALAEFHRRYAVRLMDTTRPYDGVDEVLAALAGSIPLAVLTNKPLAPSMRLVEAFGWTRTFGRVIGGDGPFPRKPDPAGLRDLMAWAGAAPDRTWLVGDSMIDVATARTAGVAICVAAYGFGHARGDLHLRGDEYVVRSPREIPGLVVQGPGSKVQGPGSKVQGPGAGGRV